MFGLGLEDQHIRRSVVSVLARGRANVHEIHQTLEFIHNGNL